MYLPHGYLDPLAAAGAVAIGFGMWPKRKGSYILVLRPNMRGNTRRHGVQDPCVDVLPYYSIPYYIIL